MKSVLGVSAILLISFLLSDLRQPEDGALALSGPYLGQESPGLEARPFAPGIISTGSYEYGGVFSPDMMEFYFIRERAMDGGQEFVVYRQKDDQWSETVISSRVGQPFVSPDGLVIHLGSRYMRRSFAGLSSVQELGPPFDSYQIMRLTASKSGTYYFDEIGSADGDGLIRYSRRIDGEHEAPRPVSPEINTGAFNAHPFIAPDESFIIWDGERDDGFGDSDLYISFRRSDGSWGEATNLGDSVNTDAWEASASVTPDGRYLFFHRIVGPENPNGLSNVDIYWIDFQIIESLRLR